MSNSLTTFLRLPRDVRLNSLVWGLLAFSYFGIFGVLFNHYLLRSGYVPETIGLLMAVGQLAWGLAALPAGFVGGWVGNRLAVIWGIAILAVATILLLCAEVLPATLQGGWIATWWIVSWLGISLLTVNSTPFLMQVSAPQERHIAFTFQQVFTGLLGFAGSLAAGLLPSLFAALTGGADDATIYWCVLWLAPISYVGALLLMCRTQPLPPVRTEPQSSHRSTLPLFLIVFMGLIVFLQSVSEGMLRTFFNIYLDMSLLVPLSQIGMVMGIGQFLPVLSSLAAPLLIERWGAGRTIIRGGVVSGLFMLLMAFFATWFAASMGYIGVLLTVAITGIARTLYGQELVAPQWRTLMSAAFTIGIALGWASAAGLGGYLIALYGYRTLFSIGAVMSISSALLLWIQIRSGARATATLPTDLHSSPS